jgi:hypothetical protein
MPKPIEILTVEKTDFTVRVYENMLKIDLKGSVKNDIQEALENAPILRETIGNILEIFNPLHVHLSDVDSVEVDKTGKVRIKLPRHRDIVIPLDPKDGKKLADKLNQLVPDAKEKEIERIMKEQKLKKIEQAEREYDKEAMLSTTSSGGSSFPIPAPTGVREKEKEAEEEQEK